MSAQLVRLARWAMPDAVLRGCFQFWLLLSLGIVYSNPLSEHPLSSLSTETGWFSGRIGNYSIANFTSGTGSSLLEAQSTSGPPSLSSSSSIGSPSSIRLPVAETCKKISDNFKRDFNTNLATFISRVDAIRQDEFLKERKCLRGIIDQTTVKLNPVEVGIIKESVELHFGAIWLWDKIARSILENPEIPDISRRFWAGIPPPIKAGDTVKVLQRGSTNILSGEYTVVSVTGDNVVITKGGKQKTVTADTLLLTIADELVGIADKILTNEIKTMEEDDPSLLSNIKDIFRDVGLLEAFEKWQETKDNRYLLAAMKKSRVFFFVNFVDAIRKLPGIEATPIQTSEKGRTKVDPAEKSSLYTAKDAIQAYEILQLIRGHTALGDCKPLTHKNLYGTANDLVPRMIENAKFEVMNMRDQQLLYLVLENQCRTTAFFVFPGARKPWTIVVPNCIDKWKKMRGDWSQLVLSDNLTEAREALASDCASKGGQLAPGYLSRCNARCMSAVVRRDFWFDKHFVKRESLTKDQVIAGDVMRFATFYNEEALTYLDLIGGQSWRLAFYYELSETIPESIGEELELFSCLADFLTTDSGEPMKGNGSLKGFGLPHLQLMALKLATDLRHHGSMAGANLKDDKKLRKAAKNSMPFSAFFQLLSCHIDKDAESLHKLFGPFGSLAIRVALFLRVEIEEQSDNGWFKAVQVFGGSVFDPKLYRKVVHRMTLLATQFITKFMGGFDYKVAKGIRKIKKRITDFFKSKQKSKSSEQPQKNFTGHVFVKLMLLMWANGTRHRLNQKGGTIDDKFHRARLYQALIIFNHGLDPFSVITENIKKKCKKTKIVKNKLWALLRKGKTVASLASELGNGMAYGFSVGESYAELAQAGHALVRACEETKSLDLTAASTQYRILLELYQCMMLQSEAVKFLKSALKGIRRPPKEVTAQLQSLLRVVVAMHENHTTDLLQAYNLWQKEGQATFVATHWNGDVEMPECFWQESQRELDIMMEAAGVKPEEGTEQADTSALDSETCEANTPFPLNVTQVQSDGSSWDLGFSTQLM